jgi:predicted nucleic acid-binding protein
LLGHPAHYSTPFPNLTFFDMGLDVARKASDIRAGARIKAPDAIQMATAIVHGATAFLTDDRKL